MPVRAKYLSLVVLIAAAAFGIAAALYWRTSRLHVELETGTLLLPRRALPEFTLIDQNGRDFAAPALRGHWSVLFFGYTNCPDFCPTTLSLLAQVEKRMRAGGDAMPPQVVFVSVDAKRDTPAQLAKYVPYFDPHFLGVTARDQSSIEAIARRLGVAVALEPPGADGRYTVDHSGALMVVAPDARLSAILTGPFTVDSLYHDLRSIEATSGAQS